ncbi:hypothetical protein HDU96_010399 [Phlyctochytrium bullatum]|nr:hypothetical protein HDU96_010399 [Phlyctochytrium bullatum]
MTTTTADTIAVTAVTAGHVNPPPPPAPEATTTEATTEEAPVVDVGALDSSKDTSTPSTTPPPPIDRGWLTVRQQDTTPQRRRLPLLLPQTRKKRFAVIGKHGLSLPLETLALVYRKHFRPALPATHPHNLRVATDMATATVSTVGLLLLHKTPDAHPVAILNLRHLKAANAEGATVVVEVGEEMWRFGAASGEEARGWVEAIVGAREVGGVEDVDVKEIVEKIVTGAAFGKNRNAPPTPPASDEDPRKSSSESSGDDTPQPASAKRFAFPLFRKASPVTKPVAAPAVKTEAVKTEAVESNGNKAPVDTEPSEPVVKDKAPTTVDAPAHVVEEAAATPDPPTATAAPEAEAVEPATEKEPAPEPAPEKPSPESATETLPTSKDEKRKSAGLLARVFSKSKPAADAEPTAAVAVTEETTETPAAVVVTEEVVETPASPRVEARKSSGFLARVFSKSKPADAPHVDAEPSAVAVTEETTETPAAVVVTEEVVETPASPRVETRKSSGLLARVFSKSKPADAPDADAEPSAVAVTEETTETPAAVVVTEEVVETPASPRVETRKSSGLLARVFSKSKPADAPDADAEPSAVAVTEETTETPAAVVVTEEVVETPASPRDETRKSSGFLARVFSKSKPADAPDADTEPTAVDVTEETTETPAAVVVTEEVVETPASPRVETRKSSGFLARVFSKSKPADAAAPETPAPVSATEETTEIPAAVGVTEEASEPPKDTPPVEKPKSSGFLTRVFSKSKPADASPADSQQPAAAVTEEAEPTAPADAQLPAAAVPEEAPAAAGIEEVGTSAPETAQDTTPTETVTPEQPPVAEKTEERKSAGNLLTQVFSSKGKEVAAAPVTAAEETSADVPPSDVLPAGDGELPKEAPAVAVVEPEPVKDAAKTEKRKSAVNLLTRVFSSKGKEAAPAGSTEGATAAVTDAVAPPEQSAAVVEAPAAEPAPAATEMEAPASEPEPVKDAPATPKTDKRKSGVNLFTRVFSGKGKEAEKAEKAAEAEAPGSTEGATAAATDAVAPEQPAAVPASDDVSAPTASPAPATAEPPAARKPSSGGFFARVFSTKKKEGSAASLEKPEEAATDAAAGGGAKTGSASSLAGSLFVSVFGRKEGKEGPVEFGGAEVVGEPALSLGTAAGLAKDGGEGEGVAGGAVEVGDVEAKEEVKKDDAVVAEAGEQVKEEVKKDEAAVSEA